MTKEKSTKSNNSKSKKVLNIVLVVVQVLLVIAAISFSISILLSTGYESSTDFGSSSIRLMPVLTDSMAGDKEDSFKAGDLIIVKNAKNYDLSTLKEGDIITYAGEVGDTVGLITHRIIKVEKITGADGKEIIAYTTMGDAETSGITKTLYQGDVKGVYIGKIAGLGSAIYWLQDPTHFFLVVMLPLILLLLYNAYIVIRLVMDAKLKKQKEAAQAALEKAKEDAAIDEEAIKKKAIEEYLAAQGIKIAEQGEVISAAQKDNTAVVAENELADAVREGLPEEVIEEAEKRVEIIEQAEQETKAQEVEEKQETSVPEEEQKDEPVQEVQPAEEQQPTEEQPVVEQKEEQKPVKKPAAKKTTAKKPAASSTAKKPTAKKTTSKSADGKSAEKKPAAKKPAAKKPATKKSEE